MSVCDNINNNNDNLRQQSPILEDTRGQMVTNKVS